MCSSFSPEEVQGGMGRVMNLSISVGQIKLGTVPQVSTMEVIHLLKPSPLLVRGRFIG